MNKIDQAILNALKVNMGYKPGEKVAAERAEAKIKWLLPARSYLQRPQPLPGIGDFRLARVRFLP